MTATGPDNPTGGDSPLTGQQPDGIAERTPCGFPPPWRAQDLPVSKVVGSVNGWRTARVVDGPFLLSGQRWRLMIDPDVTVGTLGDSGHDRIGTLLAETGPHYSVTHAGGTRVALSRCRCGAPNDDAPDPFSCSTLRLTRIPGAPQPLPSIEDAFVCDPDCAVCRGEGTVCEDHPDRPWSTGTSGDCDCGAMGVPCRPENRQAGTRKANLTLRFVTEEEWKA